MQNILATSVYCVRVRYALWGERRALSLILIHSRDLFLSPFFTLACVKCCSRNRRAYDYHADTVCTRKIWFRGITFFSSLFFNMFQNTRFEINVYMYIYNSAQPFSLIDGLVIFFFFLWALINFKDNILFSLWIADICREQNDFSRRQ